MTFDLDLWPFDRMNIWRFPYYINKPSLIQIGLQLFKWGHFHVYSLSYNLTSDDLWPWYMTFDRMNIWGFSYYINNPSLVSIRLQLFNREATFTFSAYLTWHQMTFDLDMWPLTSLTNEGSHVASMTQLWLKSIIALTQGFRSCNFHKMLCECIRYKLEHYPYSYY